MVLQVLYSYYFNAILVTRAQELFFQKKKDERRQGKVSVDIDMTTAYLYVLNQYREFEFCFIIHLLLVISLKNLKLL